MRYELRQLVLRLADKPFINVREEALCLLCEEEASVVAMRPVEKAAPCLSRPVGDSMSCVLGLDAVVSCDGGVTAGDVGRCVSFGDTRIKDVINRIQLFFCTCFGRLLTTGVRSGMYYAENMTEDNPGSSGEMCQVVSGRRLVRPTSTYTAARDALTLAHCVCVAAVLTLRQVMHDKCN